MAYDVLNDLISSHLNVFLSEFLNSVPLPYSSPATWLPCSFSKFPGRLSHPRAFVPAVHSICPSFKSWLKGGLNCLAYWIWPPSTHVPLICITFFSLSRARVPNLWDLMLDDLRWSLHDNNRNNMHDKCKALESSRNHSPSSPPPVCGKIFFHETGPCCQHGWRPLS